MDRHREAHRRLYRHLAPGEAAEAAKIKGFYDEYFAVLDLTEEFYLETIERIFQKAELATGAFTYRGRKVDPGAIRTHRAPDRRGRPRRHLRARPDCGRPRPLHLAPPAPEAPPPPGQRRPLRRLQRPPLGEGDLPGGAQHDPGDGVAFTAAGWRRSGTRRCRRRRGSGFPSRRSPSIPRRRGNARTPARAAATAAASRTIPPLPTAARPTSNCGLTSATSTAPGFARRERRRQRLGERDERQVGDDPVGRRHVRRRQRPDVQPLDRVDARVGARAPARAGRGRRRPPRPPPRPAASSTCVKPPVEAPRSSATAPVGSSPKTRERVGELQPRPRHPRQRVALDRQRRSGRRPRRRPCPPAPRRPAPRRPRSAPAPAPGCRRARPRPAPGRAASPRLPRVGTGSRAAKPGRLAALYP